MSIKETVSKTARFGDQVVIIGGSLAGLTFALACAHKGIRTCILEQVAGQDRGGGALAIDRALLMRVIGLDLRTRSTMAAFPVLTDFRRAVSWRAVHKWLRDAALGCPEITLMEGVKVSEVVQDATSATAITTDARQFQASVIIGADGYRSVVRRAVSPEQPYGVYAGYLLWRGLVRETELPPETRWAQSHEGVALKNTAGGRLIAYPVAGPDGSLKPGERLLSFAWYEAARDELLQRSNCISPSRDVLASLPREQVPKSVRDELRSLARRIWPEPWRAAIVHALEHQEVFATPISEYFPMRLHRGRLAILGDAAHAVSPVTGRGFIGSILDVETLANCLKEQLGQYPCALKSYEQKRLREAQRLATASIKWSRAFTGADRQQST